MNMHMASTVLGPRRRLPALAVGSAADSVQTQNNNKGDKKLPKSPSIRWHLVERIKKEIAEGTYDTDEKLDKALDRFLDQHGL
jgi:anti-sigma28 factor (negative regulator of flagellin synthesis)